MNKHVFIPNFSNAQFVITIELQKLFYCSSKILLTSSSAREIYGLLLGTFTKRTFLKQVLSSRAFSHSFLSSEFFTLYSPLSCFPTSSLSRLQVTSWALKALANSKAAINALYSAWLLVALPMKQESALIICPASTTARKAVAAGPG